MKISEKVHQIKIPFQVTPTVSRYVYVYLIEGKKCYLIDSGVAGSEQVIEDYMAGMGRKLMDINMILLTHAHPDHIGGAAAIRRKSGCRVGASEGECRWIQDIGQQYKERPIPNFYRLVQESVEVTDILCDAQMVELEPGIIIIGKNGKGHSVDSLSFYDQEEKILFSGDTIPVPGDIPIYIDYRKSLETLSQMLEMKDVNRICPAWDRIYEKKEIKGIINNGISYINYIEDCVREYLAVCPDMGEEELCRNVCERLGLGYEQVNPLFKRSVHSHV